jgi:hypothetical protein
LNLTFDEITDHVQFEDLAVSYFEELKRTRKHNISEIEVKPSGIGIDGGRDLLVKIRVNDGLFAFRRKWVVQCKFHSNAISTTEISDINIPSLIHSYKADGYLLICRQKPTSKLTTFLEGLDSECKFSYLYKCWYGDPFLLKLRDHPRLLEKFFPKYNKYLQEMNQRK